MFTLYYTDQANKDALNIKRAGLKEKVEHLLNILQQNPFHVPPSFEKLKGDYKGFYSRRINAKHRLVYEVFKDIKAVKVARMWTHYE
jgi:Txe/YoeB family toxin of toxin-antitoxin system